MGQDKLQFSIFFQKVNVKMLKLIQYVLEVIFRGKDGGPMIGNTSNVILWLLLNFNRQEAPYY